MWKSKLIYVVILLTSLSSYSQEQQLYFCVEDNNLVQNNPIQLEFVRNNGLKKVVLLYQDDFVDHNLKSAFNLQLLTKSIEKKIPNKEQNGLAILDWEGKKAQILFGGMNSNAGEFNSVLNEFISAIRAAKQLRPNMKWSFYGLPIRVLNKHSYAQWRTKVLRMSELMKYCDFISPSLYSFIRPDKLKYNNDIVQHITMSLELGKTYNKPVIPFIYHRYQTNSSLVPVTEFTDHVQEILSSTYQGKKVAGLIWWNSEGFLNIRKARYPSVNQEYSLNNNGNEYQKDLLSKYYNSIKGFFK